MVKTQAVLLIGAMVLYAYTRFKEYPTTFSKRLSYFISSSITRYRPICSAVASSRNDSKVKFEVQTISNSGVN